jgi:hypothetical protein
MRLRTRPRQSETNAEAYAETNPVANVSNFECFTNFPTQVQEHAP